MKNGLALNIETIVLVAVWSTPFVFQGCFKVTELDSDNCVLFFFRCQSTHQEQGDLLHQDFSPYDYELTHLYCDLDPILLNTLDETQEHALYLLKYALHITLKEMISSRKLHFTSIDDVAMQAIIKQITPILNGKLAMPEDEHIGFAVAMDFCPKEQTGHLAALTLLRKK
ncbi:MULTISPECIES: hypothetical protein [Legionella]|uniref:Uncharacterized protein n=1 Tax=Legionella maceachernii TaxID=466 RepID=A0A0W0W4B5_9GAMM|nr:hypothetical protein [Legionella maceachernii]KTD27074.1 hypothetical protein Lmac_1322 [Legionella maceachernii]SKA04464.1 hypothetical protein SAMN02745128_01880 [Legionella maceachernii]SUP00267.1 Uncharacterised protein [Legionella maceachernii]